MNKPWYKKWWGILAIVLFLWPFLLTYWIWKKKWNIKVRIGLIAVFWIFGLIILASSGSKSGKQSLQEGYKADKDIVSNSTPTPTLTPESSPKERKIVKGSTSRGMEFYEKIEALRKQGRVNGELCTEFESDPIVDVNPESPAVQLSLMYPSITGGVKSSDKSLILNDFKVIKALAEQDNSMVLPEYGTLRLFVLTFHDNNCIAKGELQQLMIDNAPEWVDWKQ